MGPMNRVYEQSRDARPPLKAGKVHPVRSETFREGVTNLQNSPYKNIYRELQHSCDALKESTKKSVSKAVDEIFRSTACDLELSRSRLPGPSAKAKDEAERKQALVIASRVELEKIKQSCKKWWN